MQTYRLIVGPDGTLRIPDVKPGEVLTVQVEREPDASDHEMLTLASARTPEERAEVIEELKLLAAKIRDSAKYGPTFMQEDLYGEDGLPA